MVEDFHTVVTFAAMVATWRLVAVAGPVRKAKRVYNLIRLHMLPSIMHVMQCIALL